MFLQLSKIAIIAIILFSVSKSSLEAVEKIEHIKKPYVNAKGAVFYPNKKIRLFSANKELSAAPSELKNQKKTPYLTLTNIGANVISQSTQIGSGANALNKNKSSSFTIYYDPIPPVVNLKYPKGYKKDGILYLRKLNSITISAKDKLSGIEQVYASMNNQPYQPSENKITFSADGFYEILVYAVDNVGNASVPRLLKINITNQIPWSQTFIAPYQLDDNQDLVLSPRNYIVIKAQTGDAGLKRTYYTFDSFKYKQYKKPLVLKNLKSGKHVLKYYSIDNAGNREKEKLLSFYIDNKGPALSYKIIGPSLVKNKKLYLSPKSEIKVLAKDDKAGLLEIIYSLNNKKPRFYRESFNLTNDRVHHRLKIWALDEVENRSNSLIKEFILDETAPNTKLKFKGMYVVESSNKIYISPKTKVSISAIDDLSGVDNIYYSINNGPEQIFTKPLEFGDQESYNLLFYSSDKLNNHSDFKEIEIATDYQGPQIEISLDKPALNNNNNNNNNPTNIAGDNYALKVRMHLLSTDDGSGVGSIIYKLNEQAEQVYLQPLSLNRVGKNAILIKSVDRVGNLTEKLVNVNVVAN